MQEYIFVLGRDPKLSLLEIVSYLRSMKIPFELRDHNRDAAVFSLPDINFNELIDRLGGTIKISRIVCKGVEDKCIDGIISSIVVNKVIISVLSLSNPANLKDKLLYNLKRKLRNQDIKFIIKSDLQPSKLIRLGILKKGFDLVIFKDFIAQTICISNPKLYEKRDKQRPNNDFLRGTSIRLSKILLNISGVKKDDTVLDPFCGLGIIIEEGLFLGFNVVGVEIDSNAIKKANQNLGYFTLRYKLKKSFKIINADSRKIGQLLKASDFDCIVSEPYFGPYIKKIYTISQAKELSLELERLYNTFFSSLAKIIKKQNIVMIFPEFKTTQGIIIGPDIKKILHSNGFLINKPLDIVDIPLEYYNPNSKIIRKIYIVNKN